VSVPNHSTLYRDTFLFALARITHRHEVDDPDAESKPIGVADVATEIGRPGPGSRSLGTFGSAEMR
jgi:hypothetical protein